MTKCMPAKILLCVKGHHCICNQNQEVVKGLLCVPDDAYIKNVIAVLK